MADQFIRYRTFQDKALAAELCQLLSENNIPFTVESTEGSFDASFTNNDILNLYYVRIRQQDFSRADELLMNSVIESDPQPAGDYYLFSFSNEELMDVLTKADEWNEFDRYWGKKILAVSGVEVRQETIEGAKAERLRSLKEPWKVDRLWLLLAIALWMLAAFFVSFYSAAGVIFVSVYVAFSKKTTPNGQRVKAFSPVDRVFGKVTLVAGIVTAAIIVVQYFR